MTQSLRCLGSWTSGATTFLLARGDVWEYWEPGTYRNSDAQTLCMAIETDGLRVFIGQVRIIVSLHSSLLTGIWLELRRAGRFPHPEERSQEPCAGEEDPSGAGLPVPCLGRGFSCLAGICFLI